MAGLGTNAATLGLSKSHDYVAQDQREFAQMQNIETDIAKRDQASMMAQELEAKQYEEIAKSAENMLAPDRVKIQSKSLELQKNIRAKIEEYGSREAFFKNGGIALLSKYKTEVLSSPETLGYMDNKKNMEQLMKIQADGKGHLISDADKLSLENYNLGVGDGKISYSGMKSEVVIPEKYGNYGEDIPTETILRSNYLQIYSNWLLDNKDLQALSGDALQNELRQYTFKNYYGQGINMQKYQNDLANENLRKQQKAVEAAGTAQEEEDKETSFVSEMNYLFNAGKETIPMTLDNVMSQDNYTTRLASKDPAMGAIAGRMTPYKDITSNYTYADSKTFLGGNSLGDVIGKKISRAIGFDEKYQVASGTIVPVGVSKGILESLFPGSENASAVNVTLNQSEFYSPNGEKLKKDFVEEQAGEPMKYQGLIYGFVDGNDKMVTNKLDSNGQPYSKKDKNGKIILAEEDKDHRKQFSGNLTQEMFAVLIDSEGRKIFKKIGSDSLIGESKLAVAIGEANNISSEKNQRTKKAVKENANIVKANWNAKVIKNNVAAASSPGQIFSTPEYKADASLSRVSDGSNRYAMTKAYYMALSAMTDRNGQTGDFTPETMMSDGYYKRTNPNNFEKAVSYSPELKDALINKNKYNDIDFINLMAKVTAAGNDEDFAHNQVLSQNWIKFYELLKK